MMMMMMMNVCLTIALLAFPSLFGTNLVEGDVDRGSPKAGCTRSRRLFYDVGTMSQGVVLEDRRNIPSSNVKLQGGVASFQAAPSRIDIGSVFTTKLYGPIIFEITFRLWIEQTPYILLHNGGGSPGSDSYHPTLEISTEYKTKGKHARYVVRFTGIAENEMGTTQEFDHHIHIKAPMSSFIKFTLTMTGKHLRAELVELGQSGRDFWLQNVAKFEAPDKFEFLTVSDNKNPWTIGEDLEGDLFAYEMSEGCYNSY